MVDATRTSGLNASVGSSVACEGSTYRKGARVLLDGLVSRTDLNGAEAMLLFWVEVERYRVSHPLHASDPAAQNEPGRLHFNIWKA